MHLLMQSFYFAIVLACLISLIGIFEQNLLKLLPIWNTFLLLSANSKANEERKVNIFNNIAKRIMAQHYADMGNIYMYNIILQNEWIR